MKAQKMAMFKHQHSLSTDSTDTDGQDRFSPLLQTVLPTPAHVVV